MIKFENRFDEYAYRVAYRELDPAVTALEEGQWVTITDGKLVVADGTKKSFLCISSQRSGRDQISGKSVKKATYLLGTFELSVSNFDVTANYGDMTPLVVTTDGILKPFEAGVDSEYLIVAYSLGAPVGGFLRICSSL